VRTGQPHRTLLGHTAPVTCLQFDELHVVSGSLDKSIRVRCSFLRIGYLCYSRLWQIWDLRTGGVVDTLQYDYPVTALQFDTRKIVAATGENGIDVCGSLYNWLYGTYRLARSSTEQACSTLAFSQMVTPVQQSASATWTSTSFLEDVTPPSRSGLYSRSFGPP
jgi:hypothetical protein